MLSIIPWYQDGQLAEGGIPHLEGVPKGTQLSKLLNPGVCFCILLGLPDRPED